MSGSLDSRPRRTRGSWIPRLTGVGVVVVVTAGGLTAYLATHHPAAPPRQQHQRHRSPALSSKVLKAQTVGLIDFGPDDDGDAFQHDPDDQPLMLKPTTSGLTFVAMPRTMIADGTPQWTVNDMADGSTIFIYAPSGKCLTAGSYTVRLAHCNLGLSQRWKPVHQKTELGQSFAAYRNEMTGTCLAAPPPFSHGRTDPGTKGRADPGPAKLARCGQARDKSQEIAFWWGV